MRNVPLCMAMLAVAACSESPDTELSGPLMLAAGVEEKVTGGGQFVHPDFGTVAFSFVAIRRPDGTVQKLSVKIIDVSIENFVSPGICN